MRALLLFLLSLVINLISHSDLVAQIKLRYENNETLTYDEVISAYEYLDNTHKNAKLITIGITDIGKPLHLFVMSKDSDFDPESVHAKGKCVIFINNGIHPGEPPGIDASIQFSMDVLGNKNGKGRYLDNSVICIIPVYNIGGSLNRSSYNRTNQDTPPESGFRGNGKNLDLNRDFIKMDSKNAVSLVQIFHKWKPEVFLDTHTTNGSDHQYTLTLISTVFQRLPEPMGTYFKNKMVPALYAKMKESPYEMIPYVNWNTRNADDGISAYFDAPRVSTGFASLFNTYAFMTENHVYKPFSDQVKSVYHFISALAEFTNNNHKEIIKTKSQSDKIVSDEKHFVSRWELNKNHQESLLFKGYNGEMKKSQLTGLMNYYYDRSSPYSKEVPFYQYFTAKDTIEKPVIYIIPQAWDKAIKHLEINGIKLSRLQKDKKIEVEAYYLKSFKYSPRPGNGHFRINDIKVVQEYQLIQFYKGDYIVEMNQPANRFIMEVLEPTGVDSYLSWNFFDPVFDRREYFSPSGFEKKAMDYLESQPEMKKEFEEKKATDPEFAADGYSQMSFIYTHSPYYEKSHRRYPVYRVNYNIELPLK